MTVLAAPLELLIDGSARAGRGGVEEILNPATGAVVGRASVGTVADADDALEAARRSFDDGRWSDLSRTTRAERLTRLGELLGQERQRHVDLAVREAGAPRRFAEVTIDSALAHLKFAAEVAAEDLDELLPTPQAYQARGSQSLVRRVPVGVVTALTPFNAPFLMTLPKVAAALATGNSVVVKPAVQTPLAVLALADAVQQAEIPDGVLNIVTGDAAVGAHLTTDPRVDLISFTGSDAVGAQIMGQAASRITRVVLELGGKSALVVRRDADLDLAVRAGAAGITTMAGQGCALLTRHVVNRSIADEYVERLVEAMGRVVVGDPDEATTTMGPLISLSQRERVADLVGRSVTAGAGVACGAESLDRPGHFYAPTVLVGVSSRDEIAQREVFGPVAAVIAFDDDDDAVRIVNDSDYGLNGAVISADVPSAVAMARRFRSGRVTVNENGYPDVRLPFGGFKRSGLGREFGRHGVLEYTELQALQW